MSEWRRRQLTVEFSNDNRDKYQNYAKVKSVWIYKRKKKEKFEIFFY